MEDPYQPPKQGGRNKGTSATIWRKRPRGIAILLILVTLIAGFVAMELIKRHPVVLESAQDRAPAFLREWLQFAWNEPLHPFELGCLLVALATPFLHVDDEKRRGALDRTALVLAFIGAVIVFGWALILVLAVVA
jgi:hypothetical protein